MIIGVSMKKVALASALAIMVATGPVNAQSAGSPGLTVSSNTVIDGTIIQPPTGSQGPFGGTPSGTGGFGVLVSGAPDIINLTSITGGVGGTAYTSPTNQGGDGGKGGDGITGTGFTLTNAASGAITGGNGSAGSDGPQGGQGGGNGGLGGFGGAGISGIGFTVTNSGSVTGGSGGNGGNTDTGNGGNGGNGGDGITGTGFTVTNNAGVTIAGGLAGNGGSGTGGNGIWSNGGTAGNGGNGISGSDITVTNAGNIVGGAGGTAGTGDVANGGTNGADGNGGAGIQILGGTNTITNTSTGTITGGNGVTSGAGIDIASGSTVSIANFGTIVGGTGAVGIKNAGTITSLTNLQGAGNPAGALTYSGTLANNYNIDIVSKNTYGQLNVIGGSTAGTMHFAINPGSTVAKGTYVDVLQGFSSLSNVTGNTPGYKGFASLDLGKGTGGYNGYNYYLVPDAAKPGDYNLVFGPGTYSTQQSLDNTAGALRNTYALQNTVLVNSFSYDCNLFGANDVCVSTGGRYTTVSPEGKDSAAVLIGAYRVNDHVRIGGWVEHELSSTGGTVKLSNNTPSVGLFGAWSQRTDGTGAEVKATVATGSRDATVARSVVGTSEAGTGSSTLTSRGAELKAKYGFEVSKDVIVTPYAGVRYTQNNMGGYTETTSAAVTAPLTYDALNTNATTALAGVGASYKVTPKTTVFGSAGVESDVRVNSGTYTASGIDGLTSINFNADPVKTRPTAMVGASYDVAKNQRVAVTGTYRQEAFQNVSSKTVFATYTVGF